MSDSLCRDICGYARTGCYYNKIYSAKGEPPFMKTRIITPPLSAWVSLAVVLGFLTRFCSIWYSVPPSAIAIHEGFFRHGLWQKAVVSLRCRLPLDPVVMLSTSQMVRSLLLPAAF